MDKFNFKAYIANNPLLKEQEELDLSDIGDDMADAADSLEDVINDELEKQEKLNEVLDPIAGRCILLILLFAIHLMTCL